MESYPKKAQQLVSQFYERAKLEPGQSIAFQGAPGANSHIATLACFPDAIAYPCFSFEDALDAVITGQAGHAVIPIENSSAGRVADMHFLLPESGLYITGEYFKRIHHYLLAIPGSKVEDIKEVVSHPQALAQCRHYLRKRGIKPIPNADTAAAAALVSERGDPHVAAISPDLAADLYQLEIIARKVEDIPHNTTRFCILSRTPDTGHESGQELMTTLLFEVKSVPAALFKALGCFATNGINMTKLESYSRDGCFTVAEFLADIEGSPQDEACARALEELQFLSRSIRILGTYPKNRPK